MAKRIVYDCPIGLSAPLLQSIDAWSRHLNKPRSEYCREILERHQHRIGFFPKENDDTEITNNPLLAG
jgi:hypothetical protein